MANEAKEQVKVLGRRGPLKPGTRIKLYDFRRPDKFSKDQLRTVSIMHETFARLATASISALLRSLAHLHVEAVDQMTYEEFIRAIPNPTTLAVINMDPLKGSAVLEIDPSLTFAMIDRLFGGSAKDPGLRRDLTDIEQSVMEGVITRLLGNLREAWSTVLDLRPRLGQIETNPLFAQIVPPREMVILITFKGTLEGTEGMLNLCVPYLTIEPIIGKLSAKYWYMSPRLKENKIMRDVSRLKAEAAVFFEAEPLSPARIARLKKNSLVRLEDHSTAWLAAGGRTVCRLAAGKGRGPFRFTVAADEDAAGSDRMIDVLSGGAPPREEGDGLENLIRPSLEKLSAEMKSVLENVAGQISRLQKRQEEMSDQLFPNGRGREGEPTGRTKPFSFIEPDDLDALFAFIRNEHPQTIALVLWFLDPAMTAALLARIAAEEQADIVKRIAVMDRTAPETLAVVERVLKKKLVRPGGEKPFTRASDVVLNVMNLVDREVEKNIVTRLEKSDPQIAETIKRGMFLFEDVALLDDRAVALLMKKIESRDLLFAMKAVNDSLKDRLLKHLKTEALKSFSEDFQRLGPVRLADVEAAQQRIIGLVRQMEDSGEIVIARSGDEVVG